MKFRTVLLGLIFIAIPLAQKGEIHTIDVSSLKPKAPEPKIEAMDTVSYTEKLAQLESGGIKNPYGVINRFGYMGKYQFSRRTLNGLVRKGYLNVSRARLSNFIRDPALQEMAIKALIIHNTRVLKNYGLDKYIGLKVRGITITMDGMLAGAHLVGPYAVKRFIERGIVAKDGNGTPITYYMKQFV